MPLATGTRVGPYEIVAPLGAGGMGEVYRARDTRLKREVALKILPESFAGNPERLARLQREAEVLASLNHPNIAAIYGIEEAPVAGDADVERRLQPARTLVLELVEGPTLADRIAAGPIAVDDALPVARQIAEALEAAHELGIIHRDLKPANIKLRTDGTVKVLDFGLAKALDPTATANGVSQSPTITSPAMVSAAGLILGTAAYMAPEQAAGKPVDKRADIWSFGVILWEMLTGTRLFDGETVPHTLADVLRAEIDFSKLPPGTPRQVRETLQRCLDRSVKNRLRDIGEARVAIEKYLANPVSARASLTVTSSSGARSPITVAAIAVAALAVVAGAAVSFVHFREQPPVAEPVRFEVLPPDQTAFENTAVLSPDGRRMAFEAPGPDGRTMLWVRSLDSLDARVLPGTEGVAAGPFWSPDSQSLAFGVNGTPGRLKRVDVSAGPAQTLCEYMGGFREGAWNAEGVILFGVYDGAGSQRSGLLQVAAIGGTSSPVTEVDLSRGEVQHAGPTFLRDGRRFLYHRASRMAEHNGVYLGSLDAAPNEQSAVRMLASDSDPVYVPATDSADGSILFLREGTLFVQSLDQRGEPIGSAISVAEDVGNLGSYGWFSASAAGALAFRTGRAAAVAAELLWFDREGKRTGQIGPRVNSFGSSGVQLSPDGRRAVVARTGDNIAGFAGRQRAWTAEVERGIFSRLNPGDGTEMSPAVSPDGRVAFSSTLNGAVGDLYWMAANGVESAEPLLVKSPTVKHPNDFSPDGRFLLYDEHTNQRQDLWILPLQISPGAERKPVPFLVTPADETFGQFSPDGKWIAYSSDESGRREVYVQGFAPDRSPAAGIGKWQISTAGGDKPRWSRDGNELYYIAPDRKMMAVPVKTGPAFEPGVAIPLFDTNVTGFFPYDVSPDGRFLLNTISEAASPTASPVTIVLNWQAGLRQ